jgi:MFS family permease
MIDSRKAWVIVWATFVCLALIFGVSYSFAAFFENFSKEFSAQRADVSWIFGLCGLVYFVLGALGGLLADRWGPKIVCMTGMALISAGLFWTSFAQSLSSIYISYGVLVGLGIAFVYTPSIASVQPWFTKHRGLASGVASSGVGAGTLLVPLAVSYLLMTVTWREALQIMALGVFVLGVCCFLFKARTWCQCWFGGAIEWIDIERGASYPKFQVALHGGIVGVTSHVHSICPHIGCCQRRWHIRFTSCGAGGFDWYWQFGWPICNWMAGRQIGSR